MGQVGSIPRLGFRGLCMQDSPLGVRDTDYVSAFPAGVNVAATWDRNLAYVRGQAMGQEHHDKGVDVQLGPVCGPLGRAPEGGRNWEGFSPDPFLTGALIDPTVRGIQDAGVIACTKHYILNEQEHFRQSGQTGEFFVNEAISSNIDDATMHELYLWPFADAVRAGTGSIMCSYNQINNSYGCANSYTLNYLLKNELDFQGFVMSDWQAQHAGVSTALAGLDMSMPGDTVFSSGLSFWGGNLTLAVANGTLPEYRLDDMCVRIMAALYKVGRDPSAEPEINFDSWTLDTFGPLHIQDPNSPTGLVNQHVDVRRDHKNVIREVGRASTVLLKNTNNALPLTGQERQVGIFGEDAGSNVYGANGCSDRGCDNGTLAMGWGSGTANFPYLITPEQALQNYVLTQTNGLVYAITDNEAYQSFQIPQLAEQADVAIVFANADAGEGFITVDGNIGDRNNLTLWQNVEQVVANVSALNNNTIVVMHTVGPVLVDSWYNNPNITAILWAGLPGQESGNAIVDVLYGLYNPGGKLPFTFGPTRESYGADLLYTPNNGQAAPQQDFDEGVFIDYRAFDRAGITPIYEFGFGLSYTTFNYSGFQVVSNNAGPYIPTNGTTTAAPTFGNTTYSDLSQYLFPPGFDETYLYIYPYLNSTDASVTGGPDYGIPSDEWLPPGATDSSPQPLLAAGGAPGGNAGLYDILYTVTTTVTNTGKYAGSEVPQLYVALGGNQPKLMLRGFDRLYLQPGASGVFTTALTRRDLSTWDTVSQNWVLSSNATAYVGSSSRNLPFSAPLTSYSAKRSVVRHA